MRKKCLFILGLFFFSNFTFSKDIAAEWEDVIEEKLQQDVITERKSEEIEILKDNSEDNIDLSDPVVSDIPPQEIKEDECENNNTPEKKPEISSVQEYGTPQDTEGVIEDKNKINQVQEKEEKIKKLPLSIVSEEVLQRPDVEKFRKQYMNPKWSEILHNILESAMEYRLYVRQQIQKQNLPEIIEYLPVVESNYKTTAKSYSGAVGMWQFMENSVYPFLTLNDFVDERLDPWYSTDAGLKKLIDNYNYFGDWLIAIAAYNCGGGAMTKALRAAGVKDYWYLADHGYLPRQTADYIPKLLAIADLAINSEYYNIDLPDHHEEFETLENEKNGHFDYITVHQPYYLTDIAKALHIEQKVMFRLNASFILGITHPTKESKIRLPLGLKEKAEEAIKHIKPIDYPLKYKVVSGDSLWSISRKYNVTIEEICELNNIKENDILRIGKILYIPSK